MQAGDITQTLKNTCMHYAEPPQNPNTTTEWIVPLQEDTVNFSDNKDMDIPYYSAVYNNIQDTCWTTPTLMSQNTIIDDTRCGQYNCSMVSSNNSQDISNNYCTFYSNQDRCDADVLKQHNSNNFLTEGDLVKLSDLAPDLINLEGSVSSELLKVVDTDDEEDLVVDDSDSDSEISINDVAHPIQNLYDLHCFVCGLPRSHTVEANFLHVDNSFPMTFVSKTPILLKLIEIIPNEMQPKLNIGDNLICRRCFNLIDTAENLELRLITVKQELCDFIARTQRNTSCMIESNQLRNLQNSITSYDGREILQYNSIFNPAMQQQLHLPGLSQQQQRYTNIPKYSDNFYNSNSSLISSLDNHPPSNSQFPSSKQYYDNSLASEEKSPEIENKLIVKNKTKENLTNQTIPYKEDSEKLAEINETNDKIIEAEKKYEDTPSLNKKKIISTKDKVSEKSLKEMSRFQCDRCGRTYSQKSHFIHHLKKHLDDFRFKCEHCSKGYTNEVNLKLHLRSHKDIRPYLCNQCPASFPKAEDLQSHFLFCIDKMHPCCKCCKMFASSQKLTEHIESHHKFTDESKSKKLECEICHKKFRYPTDLTNHAASHNHERTHACQICGKVYKHKRHLNRHHRDAHTNHSAAKEKKMLNKSKTDVKLNDKIEPKTLLGKKLEKSYPRAKKVCPVCDKEVYKLKLHMISHSNVKRHKCNLCDINFTLKQGLLAHIKRKHPNKTNLND